MEWRCTIPGRPTSKGNSQRRFGNHTKVMPSKQAVAAEHSARAVAYVERPAELFNAAVQLRAEFRFAIPKSRLRGKHAVKVGDPREGTPDVNNCLKLLQDALEGIVYIDDKQIVDVGGVKVWGERDETVVVVKSI